MSAGREIPGFSVEAARSAVIRKSREGADVQCRFFEEYADKIALCAGDIAGALDRGALLFAFGNGGSACDAEHLAVEFSHPVIEKRKAFPAIALGSRALTSAIGNDADFSLGFGRELELYARPGDIAVGISTSGRSRNVVRAIRVARERKLLTIAIAGRDGGPLVGECDHSFVVRSFSIHRIQETHEMLLHVLWDLVHLARGEDDVL